MFSRRCWAWFSMVSTRDLKKPTAACTDGTTQGQRDDLLRGGGSSMNLKRLLMGCACVLPWLAWPAFCQVRMDEGMKPQNGATSAQSPAPISFGGYLIGVGDILNIQVAEEDEVSGRYQVSDKGDIQLRLLSAPVKASGLTTFQLSKNLEDQLKQQQILKQPYVTVLIERGMTQNVTVVGPVARPGIYPIERPTHLLDILSMSGGLQQDAGQSITINHRNQGAAGGKDSAGNRPPTQPETIDVSTLMSGENREANVLVQPGDEITVSNASVVYVVGDVNRPGAFSVRDPRNGISVLRAIALVEGPKSTASLGKAIIVRKSTSNSRQEIPVDIKKIMKGKAQDQMLAANDILFIPVSGFKQGLHAMGDIATRAATGVVRVY